MDDRELETLFRDLPAEAPPATFDAEDVRRASARATARQRARITTVCGLVLVLAVGAGAFGFLSGGSDDTTDTSPMAQSPSSTTSAKNNSEFRVQEQPGTGSRRPSSTGPENGPTQDVPGASPKQGGVGTGEAGSQAGSTFGCDKVDRELATALAGEFPVPVSDDVSPGRSCTASSRSATFPVTQGSASGVLSISLFPRGAPVQLAAQPEGSAQVQRPTARGGTLVVWSIPAPGSAAPYAADLDRVAGSLAARY